MTIPEREQPAELPMAVRAWTTREERDGGSDGRRKGDDQPGLLRSLPCEALIFDTETIPALEQRLRFLVWRFYRDAPGRAPGHFCVEEGIAYPDDLPEEKLVVLAEYATGHQASSSPGARRELLLKPLSWWLQERLFAYGYRHRDRCLVVGFNLPFDLAGVSGHWGAAKGYYLGGFSLGLWGEYDDGGTWRDRKFHPRLEMNAIDPRRTLFGWGSLKKSDSDALGRHQNLLDLRTLGFALTDKSLTLEKACEAFGVPYKKAEVDLGRMSPELIHYAREDVEHTALLYRAMMEELARHPGVELPPAELYSPASVGVRYLESMGAERPLEKFTRLSSGQLGHRRRRRRPRKGQVDEDLLGNSMGAFFGGRAEARVVRVPVPVVHVDFTSMYPAINSLLGIWPILRAGRIKVVDATAQVKSLLEAPDLIERCLRPATWRKIGVTLVELEPEGAVLPVRAAYDPSGLDFGIGINPLNYDGHLWYALPDVVAACLSDPNHPPRIVRALRLAPQGKQKGLTPVRLRGELELDPGADRDPFLTMIEERARVKQDPNLSEAERERLQLFLKITANGTAYGSLARFDRRRLAEAVDLMVHGPDIDPRPWGSARPEDPGPFCFPPVAASITAGARLMLALLERLVADAGGTYAFCDTDSMAIVASDERGSIRYEAGDGEREIEVLGRDGVRDILARFEALNPYDPDLLQPWKVEYESLERPLWCYAISSKRYCLYRLDETGAVEIVGGTDLADDQPDEELTAWSEHGLGTYMDPSGRPPEEQRDDQGRRIWIREVWEWVIGNALGNDVAMPAWAARPALTRFTVSNPRLAGWFSHSTVRPGSFGLLAHPDSAFYGEDENGACLRPPQPAASFEWDPAAWQKLEWHDRREGGPVRIVTLSDGDPEALAEAMSGDAVVVESMERVLGRFIRRPEHKSLAPDGSSTGPATVGLLQRRPVFGHPDKTRLIGKEGNELMERSGGVVDRAADYRNDYGTLVDPWERTLARLKEIGAAKIIEETGFSRSAVYAVLGGARPHRGNRGRYEDVANGGPHG